MLLECDTGSGVETSESGSSPVDGLSAYAFLETIKATFPAIVIQSSRLEQSGGDHVLLIVNEEFAFRFPRPGGHNLSFEIAVLEQLRQRSPVAVPAYQYLGPEARFAGYRFIEGEALTTDRFASLDNAGRTAVLGSAARFLAALHQLPPADISWLGTMPATWTAAQFADRGMSERLPLIARHAPRLVEPLHAFYEMYRLDEAAPVIVHGDLVGEHLLADKAGSNLIGIIDFGDVALGDPAQDLLGLWTYGADAVRQVIDLYAPDDAPNLFRRSRNHHIRYQVDQLFELISVDATRLAPGYLAEIEALLTSFPFYER